MRRSVAIVGRTPMFVRWAIEKECPLRELRLDRLPETTFRQLRAVREIALSEIEHRVTDGFCMHPQARNSLPQEALGFPIAEVLDFVGGRGAVTENCENCPANAGLAFSSKYWGGCYGSLSSNLRFRMDRMTRGEYANEADRAPPLLRSDSSAAGVKTPVEDDRDASLMNVLDLREIINAIGMDEVLVKDCRPDASSESITTHDNQSSLWVRLWQQRVPDADQLALIRRVLIRALESINSQCRRSAIQEPEKFHELDSGLTTDLLHLIQAVDCCQKSQLSLHLELVPAGFSDGRHWRLFPHCGNCMEEWLDRLRPCTNCGTIGKYRNEIKLKVLGLRPYLKLTDVLGIAEVERLLGTS